MKALSSEAVIPLRCSRISITKTTSKCTDYAFPPARTEENPLTRKSLQPTSSSDNNYLPSADELAVVSGLGHQAKASLPPSRLRSACFRLALMLVSVALQRRDEINQQHMESKRDVHVKREVTAHLYTHADTQTHTNTHI